MARRSHRATRPVTGRLEMLQQSRTQLAKQARPKAVDFLSELESEDVERTHSAIALLQNGAQDDESDGGDTNADSDGNEEDTDAPRVAQWIDVEDFELPRQLVDSDASHSDGVDDDDDHSVSEVGPSRRLRSLEDDLSTLPLGALRSAQRSLLQAQALSDTDSDSYERSRDDSSTSGESPHPTDHAEKPGQPFKTKNSPIKRSNKHAPVETTSKRPVSRRRVVVDDKLPKPRDPRFMHAAGRYDPLKFKQQYEFLSGVRRNEFVTLHEHVKRARKLLANSPAHLRAEREEEVKRLERAMKRTESVVNLDNLERVQVKALQSAKQTEKEKRRRGKAGWWMKRSEKKELLAKARLEAIALVGGKQAVKKATEKKQKKVSQKEKKRRPFSRNEGMEEWSNGKRTRPVGQAEPGRGAKRRRAV